MKTLSIVIALILSLGVVTGATAGNTKYYFHVEIKEGR